MSYAWTPGSSTPLATCPTVEGGFTSGSYFASSSPSISANGTSDGLLWVVTWLNTRMGTLRAFDGTNLGSQLFTVAVEGIGGYPSPTIANGTVYVETKGRLLAYGIKGKSGCKPGGKAVIDEPLLDQAALATAPDVSKKSAKR